MLGGIDLRELKSATSAVDIVYLWVDGADQAWREKRRSAFAAMDPQAANQLAVFNNVEGRYRDNEELRFSLRALDLFFPSHGHVYIVTDGQRPSWLSQSDGLTIIDHRDLIPKPCLPTFDSGNIESYIHLIPNLSERYFYCNDDVFFGKTVNINDWFFADGLVLCWSDDNEVKGDALSPASTSLVNGCRLSKAWLSNSANSTNQTLSNYTHTPRTFAHGPRPMLKSLMRHLEAIAPTLFAGVRSTVFRRWDQPTIISDFVLRWALANGRAKMGSFNHLYISTGNPDLEQKLSRLKPIDQSVVAYDFFCINDTFDDADPHDPRFELIKSTLTGCFERPSRFESP